MKSWIPIAYSAYMKKVSFPSHPKAKVTHLWHLGTLEHSPVLVLYILKFTMYH